MYLVMNRPPVNSRAISLVLNQNVIAEDMKSTIIQAMGMAACQVHCIRCRHCSACKIGNRS